MTQIDTINVILIQEDKIVALYAYPDTTKGDKEARETFIRIAKDIEDENAGERTNADWNKFITLIGQVSDEGHGRVEFLRSTPA
jgi:hypothetical protein